MAVCKLALDHMLSSGADSVVPLLINSPSFFSDQECGSALPTAYAAFRRRSARREGHKLFMECFQTGRREPVEDRGEEYEGEEAVGEFVVAGGDAAEALDERPKGFRRSDNSRDEIGNNCGVV